MVYIFVFNLFYCHFYFLGRGILNIFFKKISSIDVKNLDLNIKSLYAIIGLFFLGVFTFLTNFLFKVNPIINLIFSIMIICFDIIFNKLNKINFNKNKLKIITLFIVPLSSYATNVAYDFGLYHYITQSLITTSKINFGIAIFHKRLAYSSIFDYISANFLFIDNFIFNHFVNLVFLVTFFFVLIDFSNANYRKFILALSVTLYGVFDNFGFNGGKNGFIEIEGIGKYDSVFAFIFFLNVYIFLEQFDKGKITKSSFFLSHIFTLFSIFLRPTGLILIFGLFYLYFIKGFNKFNFFKFLIYKPFLVFVSIFWLLKNLIISGCLIFPISFLCIDRSYKFSSELALSEKIEIGSIYKNYNFTSNFYEWFDTWKNNNIFNYSTLLNFIISIFAVLLILVLFNRITINNLMPLLLLVIFYIFWIGTAPDLRFGIGFFTSSILIINYVFIFEAKTMLLESYLKKAYPLILFICIFGFLRIDNYIKFYENPIQFVNLNKDYIENEYQINKLTYIKRVDSYGYSTIKPNEQCWFNIKCSPFYSKKVKVNDNYGYKIYKELDD